MSQAQVYVTTGIHWNGSSNVPGTILGQITQFTNLKIAIPRKGMRTADLSVNLMSDELAPIYASDQFSTYSNFLYITWRGHIVFWGPIITKEVDYEASTIILHAKDQGARLAACHFHLGDDALNGTKGTGNLPVNATGIHRCLLASADHIFAGYIPLGINMGSNSHTDFGYRMGIERGQEVWRTMLDMGDRTDGPLFELVPQNVSGGVFAVCNVYGQERTNRSGTVKFNYGMGLNNVRNLRPTSGGKVLSNATIVTGDKHWRSTSYSEDTGINYGFWEEWEQVDFNIADDATNTEATDSLGAVGDTTLDAYGRPLTTIEVVLRRDDQIFDSANQFYWLEDFFVADIVNVAGSKGPESFSGNYLIDGVNLEQESDGTGEIRQSIDAIPHVPTGLYDYLHDTDRIHAFDTTSGSG